MIPLHQGTNTLDLHPKVLDAIKQPIEYGYYGDANGSKDLRTKILDHYNIDSDEYEIILTSGSLAALHLIIDNCYPKYKNFVDIIPGWHWMRLMAKDRGYGICPVHSRKIKPEDIVENSIVFLVNGPNPTGFVYSHEEFYELQEEAKNKKSMLLHDIAYYDFFETPYPLLLNEDNFLVFSFSKGAGLASLRVGGLVASKKSFQNIPEAVPNRIGINVIGERAAMASLEYYDEWKPKNIQLVRKNQDRIRQELSPLGVKFFGPDAVHRIVLTLDEKIDPTEFNKKMASEGVQLLDISTRSYDVGVKHTNDPPFTNSLQATAAISDEWLDRFIEKFKKVYQSL
jgi:histidinol-phosphate/aromatic aminotransferase/cobyric acid decarboxylase-like protein